MQFLRRIFETFRRMKEFSKSAATPAVLPSKLPNDRAFNMLYDALWDGRGCVGLMKTFLKLPRKKLHRTVYIKYYNSVCVLIIKNLNVCFF